ncbi:MAG: protein-disulfide reductase DsbD domain-containing protein, partial [Hyphomicrobium sp.]
AMKCVHLAPSCLLGLLSGILLLSTAEAATALLASDWIEGHSSRARLIAGSGIAGVEVQMPEGWKTYWRTPGDAGGVPPSFDWSKSENLAEATVLYPAPKRLTDRAGDTIGYKGTVVFPVRLTPKDPTKPIDLKLSLGYGVCKEICIPAEAALSLAVAPDKGSDLPEELASALKQVPTPEAERRPGDPTLSRVVSELGGARPSILLEAKFPAGAGHADLFVEAPQGLFVPLPKKTAEDGSGHVSFEVDLSQDVDLQALKGQTLTATLVSDGGQSETTFQAN